jgi:DNA topoisomerase-1
MKLLIVESPAKAKTISKYLDGAYTVRASVGHIRDLPKSNKKAIDIPAGFVPTYEISKGKEKVVAELRELAGEADEVMLATDPDREGEAIAWHIAELIKSSKLKTKNLERVVFHEITEDAVKEAIQHPRPIDANLVKAQEARRVLDRLVGYDLSGLIWKKVRYGLSAGRVQSPALRIIMEREREIRAFKPEQYFVLAADLETIKKEKISTVCEIEPKTKSEADKILKAAQSGTWKVADVTETEVKRSPKAPFITSTLQQAASSRLGYTPSRTMQIAQRLYEAGHITYMRTDSTNLSQVALKQAYAIITKKYGEEYLSPRTFTSKSKNAQEAHEAIRPTHLEKESAGLNDEQQALYQLIWQRTIASQMKDAQTLRTKITATVGDDIPLFAANGSRITFPGWLKADPEGTGGDVILPIVAKDDPLKLLEITETEKFTEPPGRYSEAGLVKELEKRGIGRPSTYASIIKTLEDREYVIKENKALKPTDTGDVVSSFLEENFTDYISDSFTAEMEDRLDAISNGEAEYVKTLKDFYTPFTKDVKAKEKTAKITNLGEADAKHVCPKCASPMIIKLSRNGKFLSCSRYPDCDGALMLDGTELPKDKVIGKDPVSGADITLKTGKYGPYVEMLIQDSGLKIQEKTPASLSGESFAGQAETLSTSLDKARDKSLEASSPAPLKKTSRGEGKTNPSTKPGSTRLTTSRGKKPKIPKPRRSSVPKEVDPNSVTLEMALKYLSLPRTLGDHPTTGKTISANIGRFGPYIVHDGDFRSLKTDDVYNITHERALEILKEEKKVGRGRWAKKKKAE